MSELIIIEGPDCVGKTTAAQRIRDAHGLEYVHTTRPRSTRHALKLYAGIMTREAAVYDRAHLGSIVYGNRLGFGPPVDERLVRTLAEMYKQIGVLVLIMFDSTGQVMHENFDKKPSMYPWSVVREANGYFMELARDRAICDMFWDVGELGYPSDAELARWLECVRHA